MDDYISQLFDRSEQLYTVRSELLQSADLAYDSDEQLHIFLSTKVVDLVRVMFLYEYELLDTSRIIREGLVPSYYARRVEILEMTREQIGGHLRELEDLRGGISHSRALSCIDQAVGVIGSSLALLNDTLAYLENEIIAAGNGQTRH